MTVRGLDANKLTQWSTAPKPVAIQVELNRVPPAIERLWLAALAGAGSVTWRGDLPSLMVGAQPIASPTGGTNVLVAAPPGIAVVVSLDGAVTDTATAQPVGIRLSIGSSASHVAAAAIGSSASTAQRDSVLLHNLLVIGQPGWESKFVVAALEERGWKVDALIRVAPGVDVTQGSTAAIDTSRYSAVIALDGAATPYANRIIDFARTGGGVVLVSRAAVLDALAGLRAGTVGRTRSGPLVLLGKPLGLASLPLAPIITLSSDAVPLERRLGALATAARRIGAGRALHVGYEETWRWRMNGGESAVRDHRAWWSEIVSSVAYSSRVPRSTRNGFVDKAPMADLVADNGPSAPRGLGRPPPQRIDRISWLFITLTLVFAAEIASRRSRGAA